MSVIDNYLKTVTPSQKQELERICKIVKKVVPDAEETISYGMPAFKYKKQPLIYFGAFKNHMSLFPTSSPIKELGSLLDKFEVSKGTIKFTEINPIPESTLKAIINHRLTAIRDA